MRLNRIVIAQYVFEGAISMQARVSRFSRGNARSARFRIELRPAIHRPTKVGPMARARIREKVTPRPCLGREYVRIFSTLNGEWQKPRRCGRIAGRRAFHLPQAWVPGYFRESVFGSESA